MNKQTHYTEYMKRYADRVFSQAVYMLKNRDDAEDAVQHVFIRLWRHMDAIDHEKVEVWLMRVTHNFCIDCLRKRKSGFDTHDALEIDRIPVTADSPEQTCHATETQRVLLEAMESLPERTKSMLLMHYYQGLKYEEIAGLLAVSLGTVKTAIHRGKRQLKTVLSTHYAELSEVS